MLYVQGTRLFKKPCVQANDDELDADPQPAAQAVQEMPTAAPGDTGDPRVKTSLLAATAKARKGAPKETEDDKRLKEEQEMLHNITNRTALKSVKELAKVCQRPCAVSNTASKSAVHPYRISMWVWCFDKTIHCLVITRKGCKIDPTT